MRNILAEIMYGQSGDTLHDISKYVPDIHRQDIDEMDLKNPRIVKSHFTYTEEYKRVIYIARDPRDVFISYYKYLHQQNKYTKSLTDFIYDICQGNIWPGTWSGHIRSWLHDHDIANYKKTFDLLLIKYEDILQNRNKCILEITEFLGIQIDNNEVKNIIHKTSRNAMKLKEKKGRFHWLDKNVKFINMAISGNWRNVLDPTLISYIIEKNNNEMQMLGYLVDSKN
jgi:hypothetical protein